MHSCLQRPFLAEAVSNGGTLQADGALAALAIEDGALALQDGWHLAPEDFFGKQQLAVPDDKKELALLQRELEGVPSELMLPLSDARM